MQSVDNHTLQGEVAARDESIELLLQQIQRQQEKHQRQLIEMQVKHRKECYIWRASAVLSVSTNGRPRRSLGQAAVL